jgi:hypothetical protein
MSVRLSSLTRIGPDSIVEGGSVRRPVASDRVGGRSPLRQKSGSDRVRLESLTDLSEEDPWMLYIPNRQARGQ